MSHRMLFALFVLLAAAAPGVAQIRFADDFSGDLAGWDLVGAHAITIEDSGDPEHGGVLSLRPDGSVFALIKDSDEWGSVRVELDVLFPDDADNYLGFIYHYIASPERSDFASLYIKGNGSYVRANPWRDGNVSRLLYEEYRTPLEGDDAIRIGEWQHVKAEVVGSMCHFYVGDMTRPKVTFGLYEGSSGQVGFNPRIVGWPVWIDNVEVTSIESLSFRGPSRPEVAYEPGALLTDWQVIGPLTSPVVEIERASDPGGEVITVGSETQVWRDFDTDARGAVITGRVTEHDGPRPVAYFRTVLAADQAGPVELRVSTVDELALWVNGEYHGFIYRNGYMFGRRDWNAWWDFWKNPEHEGRSTSIDLAAGVNQLVFRVRNGQFASGGFFARID